MNVVEGFCNSKLEAGWTCRHQNEQEGQMRDFHEFSERLSRGDLREEQESLRHEVVLRQYEETKKEARLLAAIALDILGAPPSVQRQRITFAYGKYADQDQYPNLRDVVRRALSMAIEE
jgi:hypothetical protein